MGSADFWMQVLCSHVAKLVQQNWHGTESRALGFSSDSTTSELHDFGQVTF